MLLVTTRNRPCVKTWSQRSRQVQKVASLDNGQREKRRWLPNNTKQKGEATGNEGSPKVSEKVDKAKVANQKWEA
mgnify:CR=1 FL=1